MKRSDMVKKLAEELPVADYVFFGGRLRKAYDILAVLEDLGMLPPGYLKPIPFLDAKQYPLVPGDFQDAQGMWCTPGVNEWEPE